MPRPPSALVHLVTHRVNVIATTAALTIERDMNDR